MRRLATRLAVLAGAGLLALGAAEAVARVALPVPEPLAPYRLRVLYEGEWVELDGGAHNLLLDTPEASGLPGATRGLWRPDLTFRMCYDVEHGPRRPYFDADGCVEVHVNAERYRGPLRPRTRPGDGRRLVLVGDSFTFGHGVPYEDTWGAAVERALRTEAGGPVEVVDLAVSGHDAVDVAAVLRARALEWQPDRLLYGFFLNDLLVGDDGGEGAWRGVDEGELHEDVFGAPTGLASYSRLVAIARRALAARRVDRLTRETYLAAGTPGSPHFEAWRAALADMAAAAAEAAVPLDVVVFPELIELGSGHPYVPVYDAVADAARELGLGVAPVLDAWRGAEAAELWVHPTDHHPNEVAHGRAGAAVAAYLAGVDPALSLR